MSSGWIMVSLSWMCLGSSNYSGEVQGEEASGGPGPAGGH